MKTAARLCLLRVLAAAGPLRAEAASGAPAAERPGLRAATYTASPGKLDALIVRFDHTLALFKRPGMEVAGFRAPLDKEAGAGEKLSTSWPTRAGRRPRPPGRPSATTRSGSR